MALFVISDLTRGSIKPLNKKLSLRLYIDQVTSLPDGIGFIEISILGLIGDKEPSVTKTVGLSASTTVILTLLLPLNGILTVSK